ncbi:MAG: hypothetical protein COA96_02590 [SAR86 cluster bacterium]|uniref:FecR protein domain-containing protein n=1 Tax=SAR86 cluster bacterium TaxID=2030880 RepID=A0A2A5B9G1_9GAMM|nr:MAG: hypothetical protein COA96_02590 [SAR86 cluster bacterium]
MNQHSRTQWKKGLSSRTLSTFVLTICLSTAVVAQDQNPLENDNVDASVTQGFALFESVENAENRTGAQARRNNRESRATIAEPEFTLIGTSRIGGKYSATIQHRSGETLIVRADPGAFTAIPEHFGYSIVNIGAGEVSIRYPASSACIAFSEQGVECNEAGNTAELALTTAEPLASTAFRPGSDLQVDEGQTIDPDAALDEQVPVAANPFEALRAQRDQRGVANPAASNGNTAGGRFTPRRISDEDVPPGMRRVRTPFGDRLVDQ